MYFDFALNFYMTLSFVDNPFKQFGPRSGPRFCPDLIGVQTVRHSRVYNKLKLNLNMLLSSADYPIKQFGPKSGPTFCPDLIGVKTV